MTEPVALSTTSPDLPTNSGIVTSTKDFSNGLTLDLPDSEITQALQIVLPIKKKWQQRFRYKFGHASFGIEEAMKLVDQMEDEIVTTLAERLHLIATVDASPVFEGEPLIIEFVGALDSHASAKYGQDHEKKAWEVKRALQTGEDFLGQHSLDV
jgi:hypothetical protein